MPFHVFRRHQRKMMAALAIFAMVAFTLDFSLINRGMDSGRENITLVELFGRKVKRWDIEVMRAKRARANQFVSMLMNVGYQPIFGDTDTRSIVDALILEHEADRLGLPADKELAISWLKQRTNPPITAAVFDRFYRQAFANQVSDSQLLEDLANQIRLQFVQLLPSLPPVTPLDLFQAYREQFERVSALAVAFPVEEFVPQVPDPADSEVRAFFDQHKDKLPDPKSPTPGFKIPQRIEVEYVSAGPGDLTGKIEADLAEEDLRKAFRERPTDFPPPRPELPVNLFADDPDATLTPQLGDPFIEVHDFILRTLARERAQAEIDQKFVQIRDDVFAPFSNRYGAALDAIEEAKAEGKAARPLPTPGDAVQEAAAKLGLSFERTPPIDRTQAATYGAIGAARRGAGMFGGGNSFADYFFGAKQPLYEEVELSNDSGRRFLVWKTSDSPARVPSFDEVRAQVVHAWKVGKARTLAEAAAKAFVKDVEAQGGEFRQAAGTRVVITNPPVSKLQPGIMLNPTTAIPPRPNELAQLPEAGPKLRDAYFALQPKQVTVAPNEPETVYYALALNERTPVNIDGLWGTFGLSLSIQNTVETETTVTRLREWMAELRKRAGLAADWTPPEETKAEGEAAG